MDSESSDRVSTVDGYDFLAYDYSKKPVIAVFVLSLNLWKDNGSAFISHVHPFTYCVSSRLLTCLFRLSAISTSYMHMNLAYLHVNCP